MVFDLELERQKRRRPPSKIYVQSILTKKLHAEDLKNSRLHLMKPENPYDRKVILLTRRLS